MAETISFGATSITPLSEIDTLMSIKPTGIRYVVRTGRLATDAGPSDTTLYTVPDGKRFLLTKLQGMRTDAFSTFTIYDAKGDSVTGATAKTTFHMSSGAVGGLMETVTPIKPIIFDFGITLDGTEMAASKVYNFQIEGYLVG